LRRRNQAHHHHHQPPHPPRYQPSIYSYMCRGAYHASSDANAKEGGVCNGFKSQLEVLYDERQESLTRAEALKRFTSMTAEFDFDPQQDPPHPGAGDALDDEYGGLHEQAQAVLISPALIYKDKDNAKNNTKSVDGGDKNNKEPVVVNPILQDQQTLPEEELIKRQEWHCYGSTEVEYLVLQDLKTGDKKIAAVAPHNTGISRRTIESDDSIRSITRIGLGWLDIIHDNNAIISSSDNQHSHHGNEGEDHNNSANDNDDATAAVPTPIIPMSPTALYAAAKETLQRTYDFSAHVGEHMKWNAAWLSDNLRDDFPRRTYQAGQKIVAQLPVTVDQTATSMSKIVGFLLGDDDDDDDDDHSNDHSRRH